MTYNVQQHLKRLELTLKVIKTKLKLKILNQWTKTSNQKVTETKLN